MVKVLPPSLSLPRKVVNVSPQCLMPVKVDRFVGPLKLMVAAVPSASVPNAGSFALPVVRRQVVNLEISSVVPAKSTASAPLLAVNLVPSTVKTGMAPSNPCVTTAVMVTASLSPNAAGLGLIAFAGVTAVSRAFSPTAKFATGANDSRFSLSRQRNCSSTFPALPGKRLMKVSFPPPAVVLTLPRAADVPVPSLSPSLPLLTMRETKSFRPPLSKKARAAIAV